MRRFLTTSALVLLALATLAITPATAQAYWYRPAVVYYSAPAPAPVVSYYYTPDYTTSYYYPTYTQSYYVPAYTYSYYYAPRFRPVYWGASYYAPATYYSPGYYSYYSAPGYFYGR